MAEQQLLATAGPTPARSYSYDASGNVTGDGTRSFAYQDDGRMATVTAGASSLYNNYYNGLGQRYRKQSLASPPTSALFAYDPAGRLLGEYNSAGEAVREYVYLGDIPVGVLVTAALVMDNVGTGTSVVGTWATVSKSSANPSGYGNDYRTHAAGTGAESFTWTPAMGSNSALRVYARWVAGADRATNATYEVMSAAGTTSVAVNQQQRGGEWVLIGTYDFVPGQGHGARLTDNANGLVVADAVKFLPANANTVFAIHTDHLNTPRAVRSSNGNTMWRWDSDPFGASAPNEDPNGWSVTFTLPLRFAGQYFDAETGTHYNMARDYGPVEGRYLQSDPIGLVGGLNTYAYVNNNPLSFTDPRGLLLTGVHGMMREMTPSSAVAASVVGTGPASLVATPVQQVVNAVLPKNECELACYVTWMGPCFVGGQMSPVPFTSFACNTIAHRICVSDCAKRGTNASCPAPSRPSLPPSVSPGAQSGDVFMYY